MAGKPNPVGWFEIPTQDLERARKFYERVFSVTLELGEVGPIKMAMFPMSRDAPGCAGALVRAEGYEPGRNGAVVYFSVESIDETLARVPTAHGKVLMPKQSIGEYGFIAHFEDTEGNRVALHSPR